MSVFLAISFLLLIATTARCHLHPTLEGIVLSGYQGWFSCRGDGSFEGWSHYSRHHRVSPPANCVFDLWPEMKEYSLSNSFETDFRMPGGEPATLFSSYVQNTQDVHFRWMKQYGIDGVFLQRFVVSVKHRPFFTNRVLDNVKKAALANGRSFAIMYDLSGTSLDEWDLLYEDFKETIQGTGVLSHPSYQHHAGRPVVAVWGIGFSDRYLTDVGKYLNQSLALISYFRSMNVTLVLGVPTYWRTLTRDSVRDPYFHTVLESLRDFGVLQPWNVGRFSDLAGLAVERDELWVPDSQWCEQRGIIYQPVVYPGFSWHHLKPASPLNQIPRLKGEFLWSQFRNLQKSNLKFVYQAMFDEINEGTAVLKVGSEPAGFVGYEGLPSDFYLWLVGKGKECMNGQISCDHIPHR